MNILVIEDNINISTLFKERLHFHKVQSKIANTGVEAYKILNNTKPGLEFDYVITNIGLPDENGVEIIKTIKAKFKNSKIIIYSGKNYHLFKDKFYYDYFYCKQDITPSQIIDMIINNELK